MDSRRAESFSDGVFAVAITILVFNLLPIGAQRLSTRVLADHWPNYFAYVVSFLTIGIMWMNHHTLLAQVTKVDRPLLVRNLFLLMGIVAIPFPTALVAEHLTRDVAGGSLATVAHQLGIPHGTARSRLHYALHALRQQLQEDDKIAC